MEFEVDIHEGKYRYRITKGTGYVAYCSHGNGFDVDAVKEGEYWRGAPYDEIIAVEDSMEKAREAIQKALAKA